MAISSHAAAPRRGLLGTLFPRANPVGLRGEGAGEPANVKALEMEISWLKMQLSQFQQEQSQFEGQEPFFLGSQHMTAIIPPIPGAGVRATAGSPSMVGYVLSSDTWQLLISKYLKKNSLLLDVGCGSGKMARTLAYHPWVRKYVGFDVMKQSIDFCNEYLVPRIGEKFEFHHLDVVSCYNPGGKIKPTEVRFPVADGSVDLAWGCSLWTHLFEEDARHYLREVRRALAPGGLFLPTIHVNPEAGAKYSGDEVKADIDKDYFFEMCDDAGLAVAAELGMVLGQYATLFKIKPGSPPSTIVNVGGILTDEEAAEAARSSRSSALIPPDGGALTSEMLRYNALWAEQQRVTEKVHPRDFIYWFVASHEKISLEDGTRYYFEDGAKSAAKLDAHLSRLLGEDKRPIKLLEFASGYGCVSRHLKKNPGVELTSCDIHPAAVEFLADEIGVRALQSSHVPEDFRTPELYDAIFCLSFFSHMPKSTFGRWIKALHDRLAPGGHLLFTTHGAKSRKELQITLDDLDDEGFWFKAASEQHDLDSSEYGLTLSLPRFVLPTIYKAVAAPVIDYREGEWWNHQDLWVVKKDR
jgi:SAM-dependent methyltransferase